MKRETQRLIKELNKKSVALIRGLKKEYNVSYAYDSVYKFVGDFVYSSFISFNNYNEPEFIDVSFFIKPWILNETYWEMQSFDMNEMNSAPKSIHFTGAFAINDIHYSSWKIKFDGDLEKTVKEALKSVVDAINHHSQVLTDVCNLYELDKDYNVSSLTKAVIAIYEKEFNKALSYLNSKSDKTDAISHCDFSGKSAEDYAMEYCNRNILLNE